mmetsp:Transcript_18964/g.35556  ORF Transcript_18964/g.35556 Transcript_18964/m.35556 type:complete len:87 (+) Transcript_18964:859-1119(+)
MVSLCRRLEEQFLDCKASPMPCAYRCFHKPYQVLEGSTQHHNFSCDIYNSLKHAEHTRTKVCEESMRGSQAKPGLPCGTPLMHAKL